MWSIKAWRESIEIIKEIEELPFVKEMTNGTLDFEKFIFFIEQDSIYIRNYYMRLLMLNTQITNEETRKIIIPNIQNTMRLEQSLHQHIAKKFNITFSNDIDFTPANQLYNQETENIKQLNNAAYTFASLLPCFWVYEHIGKTILKNSIAENPYEEWISTYGNEQYTSEAETFRRLCDKHAEICNEETQNKMTEIFKTFANLELLLWSEAYNKRTIKPNE